MTDQAFTAPDIEPETWEQITAKAKRFLGRPNAVEVATVAAPIYTSVCYGDVGSDMREAVSDALCLIAEAERQLSDQEPEPVYRDEDVDG